MASMEVVEIEVSRSSKTAYTTSTKLLNEMVKLAEPIAIFKGKMKTISPGNKV